jgi:hypothetical protein
MVTAKKDQHHLSEVLWVVCTLAAGVGGSKRGKGSTSILYTSNIVWDFNLHNAYTACICWLGCSLTVTRKLKDIGEELFSYKTH